MKGKQQSKIEKIDYNSEMAFESEILLLIPFYTKQDCRENQELKSSIDVFQSSSNFGELSVVKFL